MTVKIKLSPHTHHFTFVEERVRAVVAHLKERYGEYLRFVKDLPQGAGLETVDQLAELLQQPQNSALLDEIERTVAYGIETARQGESAVFKPPTAEQVEAVMSEQGFVTSEALKFAKANTLNEIQTKDAEMVGMFKTRLLQTLERGEHPSKAARDLAQDLDDDYSGWMRIARTETARALNAGLFEEAKRLGNDFVFIPHSPTTCPHCERLIDGRVFRLADIEGRSNYKIAQAQWIPAVPLHPNCTHFPIPASDWTIEKAKEEAGGRIPSSGVKISYIPPSQR